MELKTFVFNPIQVNSYLLWDNSKEAVLIDCGCFFAHEKEELKQFIATNGLTLKHYLNTHLHFDHIFGSPYIFKEFGIHPEANDADLHWAQEIASRVARFGIQYNDEIPPIGRILNDGDEIKFGNSSITAIAVPGHSPGSLAYHLPQEKMLFSGDALLCNSIGRTDFPDSNHSQLISSIKERLFVLPEETIVYPGHDRTTTIGYEKEYNMFVR